MPYCNDTRIVVLDGDLHGYGYDLKTLRLVKFTDCVSSFDGGDVYSGWLQVDDTATYDHVINGNLYTIRDIIWRAKQKASDTQFVLYGAVFDHIKEGARLCRLGNIMNAELYATKVDDIVYNYAYNLDTHTVIDPYYRTVPWVAPMVYKFGNYEVYASFIRNKAEQSIPPVVKCEPNIDSTSDIVGLDVPVPFPFVAMSGKHEVGEFFRASTTIGDVLQYFAVRGANVTLDDLTLVQPLTAEPIKLTITKTLKVG